jgi:DNA-binding response OmpR family regulator
MSILSEREFHVSIAENGEDALRAIMAGGIDLVIATVVMAEMDGIELVRSVRALTGAPPTIVIARGHSALDHAYLRSAALAGATSTYTQPLRANDFLAGVQSALTLKRSPWVKP